MGRLRKRTAFMAFIANFAAITNTNAGLFGPSNYDECILENMKGATSDVAAKLVVQACRKQFPDKPIDGGNLPESAVALLSGTGGLSIGNEFSADIYNANTDWHITEITLSVDLEIPQNKQKKPKPNEDGISVTEVGSSRKYSQSVNITPLSTSTVIFRVLVEGDEKFEGWNIESARGYRIRR